MTRPPRVLLVSPIPSHPADQGNAARLQAMGRALMHRGITCDFLYVTLEGLTPDQHAAMAAFWGALHVEPATPKPSPRFPGTWGLDDWCPPRLPHRVAALVEAERHDAVIVSYVWMSRALEGAGRALRVLDTHDLFGGRDAVARAAGLDPSWFHTTPAEEARGLARADLVLAIQAEESGALAALGATDVLTVGHALPLRFLLHADLAPPLASFGVLASGNPWNVGAVLALDAALADTPELDWLVAGSILRRGDLVLRSRPRRLEPLLEVDAFYAAVGCVLNPMGVGTGLKIKTVEALAWGRPVLGLAAAFAGLDATHPGHQAPDIPALVALMRAHAADAGARQDVARASRRLALRTAAAVETAHDILAARLFAAVRG